MLVIFYGYTKGEARRLLESKKIVKESDTHFFDPASWEDGSVIEISQSKGLFVEREVFFLDHVLSELEPEEFERNIKAISDSQNIIVCLETEPNKFISKLEKSAEHVFKALPKKEKTVFNVFSLTDALFEKDKKKLWLLYQKSINDGLDPEFDIYRILFWAVKMIALAREYSSATSAGISPFVYGKAKKGLAKFNQGEIEEMAEKLTEMSIKARQGEDWEFLLEKFILSI